MRFRDKIMTRAIVSMAALILAGTGSPAASASATSATSTTSTSIAGYGASAPLGQSFSQVTFETQIPKMPRCSECDLRLVAAVSGADQKKSSCTNIALGININPSSTTSPFPIFWEVGTRIYPSSHVVHPGDLIEVSIEYVGSDYLLTVIDHGVTYSVPPISCPDSEATEAEWGALRVGTSPIPDFHVWTLTNITADTSSAGVISSYAYAAYTLVDSSGAVLAVPGPLNAAGNSFTVTWKRAA
jgi:hypothetical protein